jgi:hypothetical protein
VESLTPTNTQLSAAKLTPLTASHRRNSLNAVAKWKAKASLGEAVERSATERRSSSGAPSYMNHTASTTSALLDKKASPNASTKKASPADAPKLLPSDSIGSVRTRGLSSGDSWLADYYKPSSARSPDK